jgi:hypothetical protein
VNIRPLTKNIILCGSIFLGALFSAEGLANKIYSTLSVYNPAGSENNVDIGVEHGNLDGVSGFPVKSGTTPGTITSPPGKVHFSGSSIVADMTFTYAPSSSCKVRLTRYNSGTGKLIAQTEIIQVSKDVYCRLSHAGERNSSLTIFKKSVSPAK